MRPEHQESHRGLLQPFDPGPFRPIDAVIVPAGRPARFLRSAAQLATELGCFLLVMCSPGGADPAEFAAMARTKWPLLDWCPMTVPDDTSHPLLPATASPNADSRDWRHGSLSTKRNLALLVSRLCNWETVFLVDDDIVNLDSALVLDAASRLGAASAVGLAVRSFPDNSVVGHAHRLAGGAQDVFVGASALVVDTTRSFGFFPNVYDEDWLFLYDGLAEGTVGRIDSVTQERYDPFTEERARAEEFGDILAEGLMAALLQVPDLRPPMDEDYWAEFLMARGDFIAGVVKRLDRMTGPQSRNALRSLRAAEDRRSRISARKCADYMRRWRADLLVWQEQLTALQQVGGVEAAIEYLGTTGTLTGLSA